MTPYHLLLLPLLLAGIALGLWALWGGIVGMWTGRLPEFDRLLEEHPGNRGAWEPVIFWLLIAKHVVCGASLVISSAVGLWMIIGGWLGVWPPQT